MPETVRELVHCRARTRARRAACTLPPPSHQRPRDLRPEPRHLEQPATPHRLRFLALRSTAENIPVCTAASTLAAIAVPTPGSASRSPRAAMTASGSACSRAICANVRYARVLNGFSPAISRRSASSAKRRATASLCTTCQATAVRQPLLSSRRGTPHSTRSPLPTGGRTDAPSKNRLTSIVQKRRNLPPAAPTFAAPTPSFCAAALATAATTGCGD